MDNYILLEVGCEEPIKEILIAELNELGFEGFIESDSGFEAYIAEIDFKKELVDQLLSQYKIDESGVTYKSVAQQNWNAEWESSFEPVIIDETLLIRAPFHQMEKSYPIELIIQPKTSFGTGHHETTFLIMQLMLKMDFNNKTVFDYGSGTGILAILASKLGAKSIYANDIDDWAADNIIENTGLNGVNSIWFEKGNLESVPAQKFDIILANINKNILLQSLDGLAKLLNPGGIVLMSGFYDTDLPDLLQEANKFGLGFKRKEVLNGWCTMEMLKN